MKKIIVILGPTGVGKTAVSIYLAKELNSEIISADSMQIYKYMDIGTAKPSQAELNTIKHHLIDIINPLERFSAGQYIDKIIPIINELHSKNKIPIFVGGTGLYIKAMTRGIFKDYSSDPQLRKILFEKEDQQQGFLIDSLKKVDPVSALKISPSDKRRIIRALEVWIKTNKPMSAYQKEFTIPLPYNFIKIGLTMDRRDLYEQINKRVDRMLEKGLIEEVKRVIHLIEIETNKSNITTSIFELSSMQAIGYKEIAKYLFGKITLDEAIYLIKKCSRNYAKRQFTWFKKEENIKWIDVNQTQNQQELFNKISSITNNFLM